MPHIIVQFWTWQALMKALVVEELANALELRSLVDLSNVDGYKRGKVPMHQ